MKRRSGQKNGNWALFVMILTVAAFFGGPAVRGVDRAQDKSLDKLVKAKEGGRVESPSGTAWLVVPAGSLESDTRISIREIPVEDLLAVGPSFDLKPDGLKLLKPATLTIRFAAKDISEGNSAEDLALSGEELAPQGSASPKAGAPGPAGPTSQAGMSSLSPAEASLFGGLFFLDTAVDAAQGTVSAQVAHLSKYVLRAVSSYKLGGEQQFIHGTKKFFNIILPIRNAQGKAVMAKAGCKPEGEFLINVSVPQGQEGLAFGQAVGTKFFRVKPSSKGLKEVESIVEVEILPSAIITKETNSYNMGYSLTLGAWLPGNWIWSFTDWPKDIPVQVRWGRDRPVSSYDGYKYPGTLAVEGMFSQAFSLHPLIKVEDFPMGPEYPKAVTRQFAAQYGSVQKYIIAFQNCRLAAGRVYGLVISFHALVNGIKPMPGIPAMGGDIMFNGSIVRMTIKAQQ